MDVSIAYRVSYVVKGPWSNTHMYKLFETREAAEEFREPLALAARNECQFGPTIEAVGIATVGAFGVATGQFRFCLGPCVSAAFVARSAGGEANAAEGIPALPTPIWSTSRS